MFHFVPHEAMFCTPFGNNSRELGRLQKYVKQYKDDILAGKTLLRVDRYCNSTAIEKKLFIAKIRSNRIQSTRTYHPK